MPVWNLCSYEGGSHNKNNYPFLAFLYESTGRAIAVTQASALALAMLSNVKVFFKSISLEHVDGLS